MSALILLCTLFSLAPSICMSAEWKNTKMEGSVSKLSNDPIPYWPTLFNIEFNETSIILFKRVSEGKWWYDAANQNEIIYRKDGRGDRYCGGMHPINPTPCIHLVTQGNRYLIFPELQDCCLCCTAAKGCGILSPTWLDGAEYQGQEVKFGLQTNKWVKKGLQSNYYWATASDFEVPVELDQWPNAYQTFHVDTFSTEGIDPSLLEVPSYCKPKCPLTTICTAL
ncbi:hypothetical protein CEUSTIGMA_g11651.t1 [Chlamydomonas eustigma]|uniref:Uncharacterized protein n=1 Tax=Chlamydomonas eustigma TaxID=1157962 RepID=A0A250XMD3_9CHLO|nr:hypothetical protein CEUSTIGMA_g11651.t1 [Chlamydomonas eustigma]|eukprot:GAX84228.1 hypothetical protein CEUSTIGMA_g11651.t1 [Chlamydomonas eustigma]